MASGKGDDSFSIHYGVQTLLRDVFRVEDDGSLSEHLAEQLAASVASPRSVDFQSGLSHVLSSLRAQAPDPQAFEAYANEIKVASPHHSRSMLELLSLLNQNPSLLNRLKSTEANDDSEFGTPTDRDFVPQPSGVTDFLSKLHLYSDKVTVRGTDSPRSTNTPPARSIDFTQSAERRFSRDTVIQEFSLVRNETQTSGWKRHRLEKMKALFPHKEIPLDYYPFAYRDYLKELDHHAFDGVDMDTQEQLILKDLLRMLIGVHGLYMKADREGDVSDLSVDIKLSMNLSLDPTIRDLSKQILPIVVHFDVVKRFSIKYDSPVYGRVAQGLCFGVKKSLADFGAQIVAIERLKLTKGTNLQNMIYLLKPSQKMLEVMADICRQIDHNALLGGGILSLLHSRHCELVGSPSLQSIIYSLLSKAAHPFFLMLRLWLYYGRIEDNCMEFMISETGPIQTGDDTLTSDFDHTDSWESRYKFEAELCPSFILPLKDEILRSGKYINIVNECGHKVDLASKVRGELKYAADDKSYLRLIENICAAASEQLLELLLNDYDLISKFRSLKHLFLLDRGDWLLQFMETAEDELNKLVQDVLPHRIDSLLEVALRSSVLANDKLKDQIRATLSEHSLVSFLKAIIQIGAHETDAVNRARVCLYPDPELTGVEGLSLDYSPSWPISIVFHTKAIVQYQFIFRLLLALKHAERLLGKMWKEHRSEDTVVTNVLRQAMVLFVQNYLYYCTNEVIEPNWSKFMQNIHKAKNIENVLSLHGQFLDDCTKDCMLTDEPLLEGVNLILVLTLQFVNNRVVSHSKCMNKFAKLIDDLIDKIGSMGVNPQQHKAVSWLSFVYRLQLNQIPQSTLEHVA